MRRRAVYILKVGARSLSCRSSVGLYGASTSEVAMIDVSSTSAGQSVGGTATKSSSEDKAARRRARDAERKRRRRAEDSQLREREAAERRQRRAAAPDSAALKRKRRQEDPDFRKREAECKRRRREQYATPNARFKRDFLDRSFGHTCKVCDRLWFDNNLTRIGNIQNISKALSVLCDTFGKGTDYADYVVCATCKQSLIAGRVPSASVSYGYRYPPRPEHLPELNAVEERLIAPRLPFMSIRRLTHGNGQYGIKGQIVNVPIQVPTVVRCLPRSIPDDAAIDVHIKRKLVSKSTYKHGLVKRSNIHAWLKHLENTPLYKHLNVHIDWSRLERFDDDDAVGTYDDDEIEALPEIIDLDDPMQAATAIGLKSRHWTPRPSDAAPDGALAAAGTPADMETEVNGVEISPEEWSDDSWAPPQGFRAQAKWHQALKQQAQMIEAQGS
ncbi:uncharacterized protein LOC142817514 [Rhipicephalus microplus]|uniref:uncharacterized protein LOC142817514 n=1 Tax=Rhipicephalus microplus TaxID=6941 RepID=UPI003F6D6579